MTYFCFQTTTTLYFHLELKRRFYLTSDHRFYYIVSVMIITLLKAGKKMFLMITFFYIAHSLLQKTHEKQWLVGLALDQL